MEDIKQLKCENEKLSLENKRLESIMVHGNF
jgi:hypothetical protein